MKQSRQSFYDSQTVIPEVVCGNVIYGVFLSLLTGITTLIAKGVYDSAFPLHDVS